jgi:hypothetical protein
MGNSGRLSRNIALGIDHPLSIHPGPVTPNAVSSGDRTDEDMCEAGGDHGSRPNSTETQAGLRAQVLQESLVTDFSYMGRTIKGRLRQYPADWPTTWPTVSISGRSEDNRGLWSFMPQPGEADYAAFVAGAPASCDTAVVDTHAEIVDCLADHAAIGGAPPIFIRDEDGDGAPDILASPRFAWVPQLWETELTSGTSGPYHFIDFRPVFLESVRYRCKKTAGVVTCISWYAGEPLPSISGLPEELTALLLEDGTLPSSVLDSGPFTQGTPSVVLHR